MTWWQIPTVFWLGGGTIPHSYSTCMKVKDVGRAEVHTAEPIVPETSAAEFELAIDKVKSQVLVKYRQN